MEEQVKWNRRLWHPAQNRERLRVFETNRENDPSALADFNPAAMKKPHSIDDAPQTSLQSTLTFVQHLAGTETFGEAICGRHNASIHGEERA